MENTNNTTKVDLFTGFLGSGKTTFIKKYAEHLRRQGVSFAVIENEYGRAGIDSAQLRDLGIQVDELAGGCICCTLKVGFHDMLVRLAQSGVQRIIVEPSGIYEITQFFNVMSGQRLRGLCDIGMVLCIADPSQLGIYDDAATAFLQHQLCLSDGIILSRSQLLPPDALSSARERLSRLAPDTPVLWDDDCEKLGDGDYASFQRVPRRGAFQPLADTDHSNLFQSCTVLPSRVFTAPQAQDLLDRLISGEFGQILRVKGFVRAEDGSLSLNAVPGQAVVAPHCGPEAPALNIIGLELDRKGVKKLIS